MALLPFSRSLLFRNSLLPEGRVNRQRAERWLFAGACVVHLLMAVVLSLGPETGDHLRYRIQAGTVLAGKNIYAHYEFYNYGPAWMYIVLTASAISASGMRTVLALMLGASACGAALPVWRLYGFRIAVLFLLSPLAWLVTGWFCMFDVVSLGLTLAALAYAFRKSGDRPGVDKLSLRQVAIMGLWLGAGLIVKHNFIFFLAWLVFATRDWRRRLLIVGVPVGLFALSFVPYVPEGWDGIKSNVLAYSGMYNVPWLQLPTPPVVFAKLVGTPQTRPLFKYIFFAVILGSGWTFRKRSLREAFLWYTALVILVSPTLHVYYTFIPLLFLLHAPKRGYLLFTGSLVLFILLYPTGGQGGLGGRERLGSGVLGQLADWYIEYWSSIAVYLLGFTVWDTARHRRGGLVQVSGKG